MAKCNQLTPLTFAGLKFSEMKSSVLFHTHSCTFIAVLLPTTGPLMQW